MKLCDRKGYVCVLITIAFCARSEAADDASVVDDAVRNFVRQNCIDCHGPDVQMGSLNLDALPRRLSEPRVLRTWTKVFDKVSSGLMPPPDEPRPQPKDVRIFSSTISKQLHAASLARQQQEGRVFLRRLNRTEYETTLRDLLGTQVSVRDLLPEDGKAAGFDNVSEALDVSAVHLLKYQEAAEKAVRSVVPHRQPMPLKDCRTGREIVESSRLLKAYVDKSVRFEGDKLVMFVRPYSSVSCGTTGVTSPGRYRVKASLSTIGAGNRSLPVGLTRHSYKRRFENNDARVHDVPPGRTIVISDEFELQSRESVRLAPWDLPSPRDLERRDVLPLTEYNGPGVVLEWIEIEGPLDEFPPVGYRRLFGDVLLKSTKRGAPLQIMSQEPRKDAERLIRSLLPVAFRRPVDESLVKYFVTLAHQQLDLGESFEDAMTVAYTAVFSSPNFLYLYEPVSQNPKRPTQLDDYAVASRLSYFLWSSLPDAELYRLAANGKLRDPKTLRAQVERMLGDPRAQRFTDNFAGQWLSLRDMNATSPDPRVYGEFDDFLFWSMPRETQLFFDEVLSRDLPISEFVSSDWTFLNQRLAQHYGIQGISGGELRKVTLPPGSHRGGVLTQAAILKVTADGSRTSPVLRGVWVLEHILGHHPPPPPADVPDFEPDVRGATTIREQLDKHRTIKSCAACHNHIDPPGFALESFDPIGGWRNFYRSSSRTRVELANYPGRMVNRGSDVEPSGETAEGAPFQDIDEYKQIILKDKDQLARNLARKLLTYSTGAEIQFADREVVEQLVAKSRANGYGFRSLIHDVVLSRPFLSK